VSETFTYTVTARDNGSTPCNWVNLTLQLPGEETGKVANKI
jgi:hypothetical protein